MTTTSAGRAGGLRSPRPSVRHWYSGFGTPHSFVLTITALGTLARIVLAAVIGLGVDESYAVVLARHPSLSYFEHPPLTFWLVAGAAHLAGSEHRVIVRLPFILLFAGTTWLMYRLGARLFGEWAGAYAALLLNLSPVFSLSTGGWVLPDGPLMFAMLAAVLCLERALLGRAAHARRWWIAAGVATGLALLSKYHGIFLLAGTALYLLTRPDQRRWLARPEPYLALVVALGIFAPVLVWNAQHGFVSFLFQSGRAGPGGVRAGGLHLSPLLQNLGGQVLWVLPWIWVPLAWLLMTGLASGPRDARRWLLCCLGLGPIAVFTLATLRGERGLPHWQAPGYLMLFPLLGAAVAARLERRDQEHHRTMRWLLWSSGAFVLLTIVLATHAATGWLARLAPAAFRRGDPALEALDWSELRPGLEARGLLPVGNRFIAATNWVEGGKLAYALGPEIPVLCLCDPPHHFPYFNDPAAFVGRDAIILYDARRSHAVDPLVPHFESLAPLGRIPIHRGGRVAIDVEAYLGRAFIRPSPEWEPR